MRPIFSMELWHRDLGDCALVLMPRDASWARKMKKAAKAAFRMINEKTQRFWRNL
jgi:hypothetical protein